MAGERVLFRLTGPLSWRPVTGDVVSTRLEWEEAYRRLAEAARDESLEEPFRLQLEAVTSELRRRIGGTFTLRELSDEYARAETWVRAALAELGLAGWPRTLSLVEGAREGDPEEEDEKRCGDREQCTDEPPAPGWPRLTPAARLLERSHGA